MSEEYFYSAASNSFYPQSLLERYKVSQSWPDDAVPVSDEDYLKLFEGQADNKIITANDKGYPVLIDSLPLSEEQLILIAKKKECELMEFASRKIAPLQDALELELITQEEKYTLHQWKKYRVALSRIDYSEPAAIIWPDTP